MSIKKAVMVPHPPLIVPEIGRGGEKEIQKTTDSFIKAARFIAEEQPDTIIVISPHSTMYSDYFHISPGNAAAGSFSQFNADNVKFNISYDTEFVSELCKAARNNGIYAGTQGERDKKLDHGTMVPLYFLGQAYNGDIKAKIVRIGLSGLPYAEHYRLGMTIKETARRLNRKTAVVASGDLSHRLKHDGPYGYKAEGPEYDERIMRVMGSGSFGELFDFDEAFCESAGECGHRSFAIMAGCFDGNSVISESLSYEGPFGVGYGVCLFTSCGEDISRRFLDKYLAEQRSESDERKKKEDIYVRLARMALEAFVMRGEKIEVPDNLPDELTKKRAGTFVSLKKHGQLRGCIGTISPVYKNIAEEIINNAISACSRDYRFNAVEPFELDQLVYSVDVLGETEDIESADELDVKRYGVIVTSGNKRGLLLPNLEGIDTVDRQIDIAMKKAGIYDRKNIKLQRFEVVRHF